MKVIEGHQLEDLDRRLVVATQGGLPLVAEPYAEIGVRVGCSGSEVVARLQHLLAIGVIRRIGAVPNHYAIGYIANGMSVWDVEDDAIDDLGMQVGALPFVTHCYRRPRCQPDWPYNLFAMIHGASRDEVRELAGKIAELLGPHLKGRDILFSSRILKKSGLRLAG